MRPSLTLRVVLYLLVLDGVVALYLGDFIGVASLAGLVAAVGATWGWQAWRPGGRLRPAFDRALVVTAFAGSIVDIGWLAETWVDAPPRFLLFLVLYKLLTLDSVRDTRTIGFLAFFMLAFAASSAYGVGFLFAFVAFVVTLVWLLVLQQIELEAAPAPRRTIVGLPIRASRVFALALGASVAATMLTAGLFFVIPRIGLAALPLRIRLGPMITGFSDRVELGSYGAIETDDTIVMRVYVSEWTDDPEHLPNLRWRGLAFDTFDGRAWTARREERETVRRSRNGDFPISVPQGTGRILVQEIFREPIGTDVLFAAPRVLRLRLAGGAIQMDGMGGLSAPAAVSRLHYAAESEMEGTQPPDARVHNAPAALGDPALARYRQVPAVPARVRSLARDATAGSRDAYEAAVQLSAYLARELKYSLVLQRRTTLDPIEEFLFVTRSGNCEYFAAALAVMLRTLGIPARVVNGFQRGEWNPYGRYFMVRYRDAHSWVEAYVGGPGWITLDPSPRRNEVTGESFGTVSLYMDALRMRWQRYVVNWSRQDQVQVTAAIRRQLAWRPARASLDEWRMPLASGAAIFLGLFLLRVWLRDRRRPAGSAGRGALPRFYARAIRAAARLGLRPARHETAREFAARVSITEPAWSAAFTRLTRAYERGRFGATPVTPAEAGELEAEAAGLRRD